MKNKLETTGDDDLRPEYEPDLIRSGVRGKYFERYRAGTTFVLLEPDVAKAFPDADAVNEALRGLMRLSQRTSRKPMAAAQYVGRR